MEDELIYHVLKMFEADESYGTGFYNSTEWQEHYKKLRELSKDYVVR